MNGLGLVLVGCVVRGTIVAAAGAALLLALRRRGPAIGATVASTTLAVLVLVTALSPAPYPRWWTLGDGRPPGTAPAPTPGAPGGPAASRGRPAVDGAGRPGGPVVDDATEPWAVTLAREFGRELRSTAGPGGVEGRGRRWTWPARIAAAFLAGLAIATARLLLGLRSVRALRRRARPVDDPALAAMSDALRASLGVARPVALLESAEVSTPATVGWRRPAVLLPPDWRDWDEQERRAVLAHELAHVGRGDYAVGLAAQVSLALHFYQPLAHWLAARLRLQQELAADARAADVAGGSRRYLATLARMALRQSDRPGTGTGPEPGLARAFLSHRGTFFRRIEMLREPNRIGPDAPSKRARALTVAALAAAGLLVAGLRGPDAPMPALAQAQAKDRDEPRPARPDFDLSWVPGDAALIIAARPAELLARPEFEPLARFFARDFKPAPGALPMMPDRMEQVVVFWLHDEPPAEPGRRPRRNRSATIYRTKLQDMKATAGATLGKAEEVAHEGGDYLLWTLPGGAAFLAPDDRTLIKAPKEILDDLIRRGPAPKAVHAWDAAWAGVDRGQVAIAGDSTWLTAMLAKAVPSSTLGTHGAAIPLTAISPLWESSQAFALGVRMDPGLKVDALATCASAEAARRVGETSRAALTLARNLANGLRRQPADPPNQSVRLAIGELIDPLLDAARVEVREAGDRSAVRLASAPFDAKPDAAIRALTPAVRAARSAALRAQSVNNLKQIGLAMFNYYNEHDHLPPAVLIGPDGKTPYSWRVALLPYVGQGELFKEYNFNEPWDGPNNRKLLDKIPRVYRAPTAEGDPTFATYFVPTGGATLFPGREGTPLSAVRDGTSNTIMAVEARRPIPWTRPEDIPLDDDVLLGKIQGELPGFGGYSPDGFNALFGDGSVHFLKDSINPTVLRALLTKAGGEVVSADSF